MGEFTDGVSPDMEAGQMKNNQVEVPDGKVKTDVPDVFADGVLKQGIDELPVFNVDKHEFYQNMADGRRRLRFKSGSPAQKYMQNTKYRRPFFLSFTDDNGKTYRRKVK